MRQCFRAWLHGLIGPAVYLKGAGFHPQGHSYPAPTVISVLSTLGRVVVPISSFLLSMGSTARWAGVGARSSVSLSVARPRAAAIRLLAEPGPLWRAGGLLGAQGHREELAGPV